MLFDLKGKRRRTVQATYVALAFLMVIGLVGAGVGSGVSGGVFDLFSGGNGKSNGNQVVENKIKAAQKRLRVNPKDQVALATIVRSHYELASVDADQRTGKFNARGRGELAQAATAWQRYVAAVKKVDPSLAGVMLNAFGKNGLNRPQAAADTAEVIAAARGDAQAYIRLTACATVAGQNRKATLAADKAAAVAPKGQAKAVKQYIQQAKAPSSAPALCSQ